MLLQLYVVLLQLCEVISYAYLTIIALRYDDLRQGKPVFSMRQVTLVALAILSAAGSAGAFFGGAGPENPSPSPVCKTRRPHDFCKTRRPHNLCLPSQGFDAADTNQDGTLDRGVSDL